MKFIFLLFLKRMNQIESSSDYGLIENSKLINYLTNHNKMMEEQIQMIQNQIQQNNIFIQNLMYKSYSATFYGNIKEKVIYIKFNTALGLYTLIYTRENIPVKTLLEIYMIRINKENFFLNKDIIFLYNARKLDINDTREISHPDINIHNNSQIFVYDGKFRF